MTLLPTSSNHRTRRLPLLICLIVSCGLVPWAVEGQWPQFRGPTGDGHVAASDAPLLPLVWSETQNVTFKIPVPGKGWSSPIVQDGKVWLTTALEDEHSLRLLAYDLDTGDKVHDIEVFRPEDWLPSHADNSYASPTPVAEAGRIYVHFGTYGTAAFNTVDGSPLWTSQELTLDHEVGPGSSPILYRDLLIVHCDGADRRYVAALDKTTGKLAWSTDRSLQLDKKGTHKKAFSTPLVVRHAGRDQLISPAASQVSSYDPLTGEEIWRVRYEGYSNVPRPVAGFGMVFVNTGYMKPHLLAIHLGGEGDVTDSRVVWDYYWQVAANPSPLLIGPRLYMINDWGNATWLDAHRGEDIWRHRLRGKYTASPIYAAGHIYNFSLEGKSVVLEAADEVKIVATNHLDEGIKATPAVADGALFVRTLQHLYRIESQPTRQPEP